MQASLDEITKAAFACHLDLLGTLQTDGATAVLLGPRPPEFWPAFTDSPEYHDGAPDPLDRWSKRIIGALAAEFGGTASFPSDGPPYPLFLSWALDSGRCWVSPIGMLVHDRAGLFVSFRGALRLPYALGDVMPEANPCLKCADQPCVSSCPVDALQPNSYDVPACQTHILEIDSAQCGTQGCAARRACPISQSYGRQPEQSAFHMRAFLGK